MTASTASRPASVRINPIAASVGAPMDDDVTGSDGGELDTVDVAGAALDADGCAAGESAGAVGLGDTGPDGFNVDGDADGVAPYP